MSFGLGRGIGRGGWGRGKGFGGGGGRRGWFGRRSPIGPPENCICPSCGTVVPHRRGLPCFHTKCPNCSSPMTRQFFPNQA